MYVNVTFVFNLLLEIGHYCWKILKNINPKKSLKFKMLSKEAIEKRNKELNEKKNAESLEFMKYVCSALTQELEAQYFYAKGWEKIAIEREIKRRNKI
jgi:hypothetical protein